VIEPVSQRLLEQDQNRFRRQVDSKRRCN